MTITIPTTTDIGRAIERSARRAAVLIAIAIVVAHATYRAGYRLGRAVHALSDWLAQATHHPLESTTVVATAALAWADRVLAKPEPAPAPTINAIDLLGAEILTDEQLLAEIAQYDAGKRPAAKRKPGASPRRRRTAAAA